MYDFLIVGAGIAGASLAWRLAQQTPGASTLLIERESQLGYHSTGRSAAMFMETYGPDQVRALTRASRAFYERPPQSFCEGSIMAPRGCLYIGWEGQGELLQSLHNELYANGGKDQGLALLDAHQTLAQAPILKPKGLLGAIFEPAATDLDVGLLHQGFLNGAKQKGTQIWTKAELAQAIHSATSGAWSIRLADQRVVQARTIVNAAGAWADVCAQRCGQGSLGLQPKRRSAFVFEARNTSGELIPLSEFKSWPCLSSIDETWYFKPESGLLLGSPANADPVVAHDVQPEQLDIAVAIAHIEEWTGLKIRRPKRTWAGLRTFASDGELVIGPDADLPSFFWLAGQGGYGIQSAAGASACAAALLLGSPLPEELLAQGLNLTKLSPARFQG